MLLVAIRLPSGENATQFTTWRWPVITASGSPLWPAHSRAVVVVAGGGDAGAIGGKHALAIGRVWPCRDRHRRAAADVPGSAPSCRSWAVTASAPLGAKAAGEDGVAVRSAQDGDVCSVRTSHSRTDAIVPAEIRCWLLENPEPSIRRSGRRTRARSAPVAVPQLTLRPFQRWR